MQKSALYYKDKEAFSFREEKVLNSVSDNYADSILIGISYNMGKGNPFLSTINTRYNKCCSMLLLLTSVPPLALSKPLS